MSPWLLLSLFLVVAFAQLENPYDANSAKGKAWARLTDRDRAWLGSADPTDPFICARAPDRCAPREFSNVEELLPERQRALLNEWLEPAPTPVRRAPRGNTGGVRQQRNPIPSVGRTCVDGPLVGTCTDLRVDPCDDGRVVRNKCRGPNHVRCCIRDRVPPKQEEPVQRPRKCDLECFANRHCEYVDGIPRCVDDVVAPRVPKDGDSCDLECFNGRRCQYRQGIPRCVDRVAAPPVPKDGDSCDLECFNGRRCQYVEGIPRCVDIAPQRTCRNVRCAAGQRCEMQQVQCIRAPCPSLPTCVADPQPTLTCASLRCREGYRCQERADGPRCVRIEGIPSCANVQCEIGFRCELTQVQCIRAPCYPIPQCKPIEDLLSNPRWFA